MSNEMTTNNYLPQKINKEHLERLEVVSSDFYYICQKDDRSPITAIQRAAAMAELKKLLTPEIMAPVMEMQGNVLGFKTDKDKKKEGYQWVKGDGYHIDVVRDTFIFALGKGARMINNEVNIIAENPYLTKNFFFRALDEKLGTDGWLITHNVPHVIQSKTPDGKDKIGAVVESTVWWRDSATGAEGKTQVLKFAIKGDSWATSDSYTGKADRKAGNWLLANVTGKRFIDADVDDFIDVTSKSCNQQKESIPAGEPIQKETDLNLDL